MAHIYMFFENYQFYSNFVIWYSWRLLK